MPPVTDLPLIASGKVREMYDLGDRILMVASDRISTYDVVHPTPIPDKGAVLTGLSAFWFGRTGHIVKNHYVSATEERPRRGPRARDDRVQAADAAGRVRRARLHHRLGLEGLPGHGEGLGHRAAARACASPSACPTPVFTPSTKADEGHDEAIDFDARRRAGRATATLMGRVRDVSIELYRFAAEHARERGVILADTKFEFGLDDDGELVVGDEVLTPDSSRYWPADGYQAGQGQPSFDKQYVRDWAAGSGWDKTPPAPALPDDVVQGTRGRYVEAYERITGEPFDAWLARTAP